MVRCSTIAISCHLYVALRVLNSICATIHCNWPLHLNHHGLLIRAAHYVSDRSTNTSRAVCALQGHSRWAVTGTPFQNRLNDLATICQFLRVYPYDDPKTFDSDILQVWKGGSEDVAIARLKKLLQSILLRRATSVIHLPTRTDFKVTLQLSYLERQYYDTIESNVATSIDVALNTAVTPQASYINVLQQINELRLICNLGMHRSLAKKPSSAPIDRWDSIAAQKAFEILATSEDLLCFNCRLELDSSENGHELSLDSFPRHGSHQMYSCLRIICANCDRLHLEQPCGHCPPCAKAPVAYERGKMPSNVSSPTNSKSDMEARDTPLPTKIRTLIEDLLSLPRQIKRYVSIGKLRSGKNLLIELSIVS